MRIRPRVPLQLDLGASVDGYIDRTGHSVVMADNVLIRQACSKASVSIVSFPTWADVGGPMRLARVVFAFCKDALNPAMGCSILNKKDAGQECGLHDGRHCWLDFFRVGKDCLNERSE